ncbi:MAG: glycoside hydrolase family 78 protein [Muribaculaceae bacterium]|jgi:alpha-L-rhamnosidase|nr:glycoside hydrolase family 78 protein [Muribaculaceae bacterium]
MKSLRILIAVLMAAVAVNTSLADVVNLTTEYMNNPLGIDVAAPQFGWQMSATRRGASQQAYRLVVAESEAALASGNYVYDSGKINSDKSVAIPYAGTKLKPATRYYWNVTVTDEQGEEAKAAEPAWFETGIDGWSNAQWIGSSEIRMSPLRSSFGLDCLIDFQGDKARVIWGARDVNNYCFVELRQGDHQNVQIGYVVDGKETVSATEDCLIAGSRHTVRIDNLSSQHCFSYRYYVEIDGNEMANPANVSAEADKYLFVAAPYPVSERRTVCRLYKVGVSGDATLQSAFVSKYKSGNLLATLDNTIISQNDNDVEIGDIGDQNSAPLLRKTFEVDGKVKSARLYATARGIYECQMNGKRVGADFYNPGWTDYRNRIMYNTYDVTSLINQGKNAIGATLGSGWWSNVMAYQIAWQDQYGERESLMAKLVIDYDDGTRTTVVSDSSWLCNDNGPVIADGMLNGETYDARREVAKWSEVKCDTSKWSNVDILAAPDDSIAIQAYIGSPVRNNITLTAKSVKEPVKGVWVYDMGQNMAGVPRIKLHGAAGDSIVLKYGEMIYPETLPTKPVPPYTLEQYEKMKGQVYTDNYRSALSTDVYVMKGDAAGETFEPHFTQHGFRYIEIHGLKAPLALADVEGLVLESIGEQTSGYETSDENINRLYENILWGQRGNFISIPTDCPQRDERLGWTGDAQIFAKSATYNANVEPFYRRWLNSIRDDQGKDGSFVIFAPTLTDGNGDGRGGGCLGWMESGTVVPWQTYLQYGDTRLLAESYESMKRYLDYLEKEAVDYVQPYGGFGDWLALDPSNSMLTNTAFFGMDAEIMQKAATALGKTADAKHYADLLTNIKESFNRHFVAKDGKTTVPPVADLFGTNYNKDWFLSTPKDGIADTQTSYIMPLKFGLLNEVNKKKAVKLLVDNVVKHGNTLTTGFIGTPFITQVLSDNGHGDLAYKLFQQTAYPSWLYPVLQGATTVWERWNSYTIENGFGPVDMNSFNHYSYGAIEEWMMGYSAGIKVDENNPGYKHFILQPSIGGTFDYVKAHFDSPYGRIESGWQRAGKGYTYSVTVPANTSATLILPNNGGISKKQELKAGKYEFKVQIKAQVPATAKSKK